MIAGELALPTACVIGGETVAARSGRSFATVNPATGAVPANRIGPLASEEHFGKVRFFLGNGEKLLHGGRRARRSSGRSSP
ncbi:MAG: hypothetical protein U1E59_19910 [Amaricoccus sp.]